MIDRYKHLNIKNLISGYMISKRFNESSEDYFNRAKNELISHLESQIIDIKKFSMEDFLKNIK